MSLVFKSSVRENIKDVNTFIVDTSQRSTNYFRVSDVPQVLQKGKNLLRITAHPTNLVEGSQIYVDVRDSNGNPIYYEIPDYLEDDKSRVISIWIYHDKGDDNTPNGEATITIAGIANVDLNGNQLPERHRGKINVKWQTAVTVDRDRANTSDVIFNPTNLPSVSVSQSIEAYENQPQVGELLNLTSQTGKVQYISRGDTPIIQTTDGGTFNSEMVSGSIILDNFTEAARPLTTIENPLSSTFFSSSVKEILSSTVLKPNNHFTTSFDGREDLTHTFDFIGEADYEIKYFRSGSNVSTENKRNFVNLTLTNLDPITGVVDKIRILQKSDGLPGDFELLNEVSVPFSSSVDIKAPIPSKNLKDPKILKLLYLNSQGGISRTETISSPFVFDGENIYIGGSENLISGSIFISNTLGTGIEIGGASSGFIRSVGFEGLTSASLGKSPGGFIIYSGSGNLKLGEDNLDGVGVQFVGDNDNRHFIFTTDNGGLLDVKTDKFFIGTENTQFISGSDGNIEISSSIFHLDPEANLLVIGADAQINADLSVNNIFAPAGTNILTAKAAIKSDGFAKFVSASIGGWDITTSSIEGGNLIMKPEGILQTRDFASGLQGWKISSEGNGTAEFENIRIRGTLRTTTFEKESVNAVGGQLWVANSTTLTGSIGANDVTMSVKNASGFSAGEILLIKKVNNTGFQTEYVLLNSASIDGGNTGEDDTHGRIMVTRAYGSGSGGDFVGDLASASQSYDEGQVIVSTGKINTGYIKMNANPNDTATPFIDIVERTGSGLYDVALKARLGDLGGLANSSHVFGNSNPGFGLATENVFLQGGIIANTGSIGGINMDAGKLFTGEGQYNNSNTGFYVDSGSQFSLGTKLVWNPSTEALVIRGQLQLSDGTDVGTAIENVSTPTGSQARIVTLAADKYVVTFDAAGNESPSSQVIGLTASAQNFGLSTVYYEFYKNQSLQGSRGTTNLFEVNTVAEKPTASAPVTYEVRVFTQSSAGDVISTDSLTLFGIQPGSDGTDGTDAVTALLTNESHTFPADTSGNIASFVGGTTDMQVFEGVTDKTSQYVISSSNGAGMTATDSGNTVTITGMSHDSGSVKITATSASVSLDKTMSLSKAKTGTDGTSAKLLTITSDSPVFSFVSASSDDAIDNEILLTITQQNLSGTVSTSDLVIKDKDGATLSNPTLLASVSSGTGQVSGSITFSGTVGGIKTKLPLDITVSKDSLSDTLKIFKVEGGTGGSDGSDGTSAVTALLTNDSHTLPVSSSGNVISFAGANTDIIVFQGTSDVTSQYTVNTGSVSSHITTTTSDNTVTITNSTTPFSGSVVITATSASVVLSKTMTISQALQGDDGADGADGAAGASASLISLTGDSQIFAFPSSSATTPEDTTIELFVTQQNLGKTLHTSDITITDKNGDSYTTPTFSPGSLPNNSGILSGSLVFGTNTPNGSNKDKFPITITATSESLSDSFKIFALDGGADGAAGADGTNGTDAITVILSNESHTIAAASDGTVASFSGAETDVTIFEGVTDKTTNYFINGVSNTGVTVDNDFNSFNSSSLNVTAMSHDSGSVIVTSVSGGIHHSGWGSRAGENWTTDQFVFNNSGDIDGTDNDWYFVNNPNSTSVGTGDGELRNNYVEFGDNSGDDEVWIVGKDIFAYDDTKTYYIEARFKRINGSGTVFVGVNGWQDESTKKNKGGSNSFSSQHYIAANGFTFGDGEGTDWVTMRGYFSGHSSTGSENTGEAPDINTPKSIHTAAAYISPMFLANYDDQTGKVRLDYVEIKEVKDGSGNLSAGTVKVDKTMTLAKSKAGTDGTPGSDAKLITLTSDSQVFTFASSSVDTPDDTTIELFINQQNLSGTITASDITITDSVGATYTVPTFAPSSLTDGTGVISGSLVWNTNTPTPRGKFPITISVTKDGVTDSTKIFTLDGGADGSDGTAGTPAKSVSLTATTQIISYNAAGSSPDVASITLTATSQNFTNGYFKFTGGGSDFSDESSYTDGSGANSDTATFTVPSSYSSTPYTFTVSVQEGDSGGEVASDTITIASVQPGSDGAAGADAFTVVLTNESHTLTQTSPQAGGTIDFTASGTDIIAYKGATQLDSVSGTPGSGEFKVTATGTNITPGSITVSGNNAVVADHSSMTAVSASIGYDINLENTVTLAKSQSFSISQAADSGSDGAAGADAYTVIVSNESHTIPQSSAQSGGALNFVGSGTDIIVYKGTTELQHSNTTPGSGEFKVTASGTNITPGSITQPGRPAVVADHSGMNETSASIKYTVNVENSATFTKNQSFTISQAADSGSDGATGATGPNFGFLTGSLETVNTSGGLSAGLLMTSKVFGFHGDILEGDGTNATLGDFTSYLDHSGSFYLGGGESGASTPSGGYFAWNNDNKSLLISGSNAEVKVDKFFFGTESTQFLSGSNGNVEISGSNFHLDNEGNVKVNGNITVTNPSDFADPNANVTTEAIFEKFGGVTSPITSTNYYLGNLVQNLVTQTDGGTSFSGIKFEKNGSSNAWDAGFATKTTFTSSLEPIATIDVVLNEGVGTNGNDYPPYQMFGFSDIDSDSDITTANHYYHITHGIYITRVDVGGSYYNTFQVRENNGAGITASDYYTVNSLTANATNGPWVSGQDTFMRFTIQPKEGGGAIYKAFRNGNFLVPIWSYVTSTYEFTGNQTFFWSAYWGESNSSRKEIIFDQLSIGAAPPAGTVISGDGITAGTIVSTNLNADSGSQLLLDDGSMKMGGTTSPGFEVTTDGFVTVTNLVEKAVTVTNSNSGSFFQTYDGSKSRLILDGSLGGAVTMNMTIETAPPYEIYDIQFPSNAGSSDVAKLQLTVLVDGVTFNEASIFSGFTLFANNLATK